MKKLFRMSLLAVAVVSFLFASSTTGFAFPGECDAPRPMTITHDQLM